MNTAVIGDSAGGGMTLGLCHAVRDAGLPQPRDAVLLCPWMHVVLPDPAVPEVARNPSTFNVDDLRAAGLRYAGGDPVDTPLFSPGVGALDGLPRLTVFSGTHDVLHPDTQTFCRRAAGAGLDVEAHVGQGAIHMWMYLPGGDRTVFGTIRERLAAAA